jgi:predicted dehydrogenase
LTPLRIGLLGASRVAVYAILEPAAAMSGVEIVAVAARDPERARVYAATHGIARAEADYQALVECPDLDLIYISTAPRDHVGQALAAIEAGKPVLIEKPVTLNATEARVIHHAAARAGTPVFEAMHSLHHGLFARIQEIVASGEIGRVRKIDAMFGAPIDPQDPLRWQADLGGGALMDLGAYPMAWLRRIAGEAFEVLGARQERVGDVDSSFQADLVFAGDIKCRAYASMTIERPTARLQMEGDRGMLLALNPLAPQLGHKLMVKVGDRQRTETVDGPSSYAAQLAAVRRAVLGEAPFPLEDDDYVRAMAALDKVRAALR